MTKNILYMKSAAVQQRIKSSQIMIILNNHNDDNDIHISDIS